MYDFLVPENISQCPADKIIKRKGVGVRTPSVPHLRFLAFREELGMAKRFSQTPEPFLLPSYSKSRTFPICLKAPFKLILAWGWTCWWTTRLHQAILGLCFHSNPDNRNHSRIPAEACLLPSLHCCPTGSPKFLRWLISDPHPLLPCLFQNAVWVYPGLVPQYSLSFRRKHHWYWEEQGDKTEF